MSVSTFLQGEYGLSDISLGVPVILGKNGVERIIELKLNPKVKEQFKESATIIRKMINKL
jgi:malate dehydrogenase